MPESRSLIARSARGGASLAARPAAKKPRANKPKSGASSGGGKEFRKVAVLMGGRSAEREISLKSGSMVLMALNRKGVHAYPFDPSERPLSDLLGAGFDAAFIALHGRYGEDGTLQGALEVLGIPYTGTGVMGSAIAIDKVMTKRLWESQELPTPAWRRLDGEQDLTGAFSALNKACVVKPAREGSTLGLSKVTRAAQMKTAYALARKYDDLILAEQFISGRELTVAIVGTGDGAKAMPIIEIQAPDGNYDYQNKYFTDETTYLCPAPLSKALTRQVQQLSVQAYRALDGAGWGRIDLMLDDQNRPWLLELNTSPGMTDHSLVPMAAKAIGIEYDDLVVQILNDASLKSSAGAMTAAAGAAN